MEISSWASPSPPRSGDGCRDEVHQYFPPGPRRRLRFCPLKGATIAIFSARSADTPVILSSEGHHYREFFHEGWRRFYVNFPSIWEVFWSEAVVLVVFGGRLDAGGHFLMILGRVREAFWSPLAPLGTPCAPRWCTFGVTGGSFEGFACVWKGEALVPSTFDGPG